MIIDVDVGNSRIKWRTSASPDVMVAQQLDGAKMAWAELEDVTRVRVAAVVGLPVVRNLQAWFKSAFGVHAAVAEVSSEFDGMTIAYASARTLGVDRWLNMLAARRQNAGQDVVVVSAGTALTIDYLDGQGRHRGGYIMPGWGTAANALFAGADRINCSRPRLDVNTLPASTTQGCVDAGFSLMYRSVVEAAAAQGLAGFNAAKIVITGGDGELLASVQRCSVPMVYDPLLVFRGLEIALP